MAVPVRVFLGGLDGCSTLGGSTFERRFSSEFIELVWVRARISPSAPWGGSGLIVDIATFLKQSVRGSKTWRQSDPTISAPVVESPCVSRRGFRDRALLFGFDTRRYRMHCRLRVHDGQGSIQHFLPRGRATDRSFTQGNSAYCCANVTRDGSKDKGRVSDDADVVRRWAVAGYGLVYKSRIDLAEDLRAGRLVEIFSSTYGEPAPLNLVTAHRTLITPAVQKLRDFLQERCAEMLG
jgi:hypothetical protein